jgi:hypothetical protein
MKFSDEVEAPVRPRMSPFSMIATGMIAGMVAFGLAWAFGLVH